MREGLVGGECVRASGAEENKKKGKIVSKVIALLHF